MPHCPTETQNALNCGCKTLQESEKTVLSHLPEEEELLLSLFHQVFTVQERLENGRADGWPRSLLSIVIQEDKINKNSQELRATDCPCHLRNLLLSLFRVIVIYMRVFFPIWSEFLQK